MNPKESAAHLLNKVVNSQRCPTRILLHLDITEQRKLPHQREQFLKHLGKLGIQVWNHRIANVSKPVIQRMNRKLKLPDTIAPRKGPDSDLLIVKTKFNSFGYPEGKMNEEERSILGYARRWTIPAQMSTEYPVLRRGEIPVNWWNTRHLVMERFVTNRKNQFLRVFFSGRHCVVCLGESAALVKRPQNGVFTQSYLMTRDRATDPSAVDRLPTIVFRSFLNSVRFADDFGLDYGAIDLVLDDQDTPYIIDVNPTPSGIWDLQPEVKQYLRAGFSRSTVPRFS